MKEKSGSGKRSPYHAHKLFVQKSTPISVPLLVDLEEEDGASNDKRGKFVSESSAGEDHESASVVETLLNIKNCDVRQRSRKHEETHDNDCEFEGGAICTECNESGDVLVCSEKDCSTALHDKCIGSDPIFDSMGKYYCPCCWYKLALAEVLELRKKAMLAKVALSKFLSQKPVAEAEVKHGDSGAEIQKQNVSIQKETVDCTYHEIQLVGKRAQDQTMHLGEDQRSVSETKKCTMGTEEQIDQRTSITLEDSKDAPTDVDAESIPPSSCLHKNKIQVEPNIFSEKKMTFLGSRKRLHWTEEEENMLREGVAKFTKANQRKPWRKILEFGRHVFDNTRTPVDLKDKWRNLISK